MNFGTFKNTYFLYFAFVVVGLASLCLYFHAIDHAQARSMLHESGKVEILSAIGYFLCLFVMLFLGGRSYLREHFPLVAFVALFGLRELDFDKRFTETGLLQSRIFTSGDVVLMERIIGIVVMLSLAALVIIAIRKYLMLFLKRLLRLDTVAVGIGLAATFMVVSKSLDGVGRKLKPLGIFVSDKMDFSASILEEVLEFGIPVVLIITVVAYCRQPANLCPATT